MSEQHWENEGGAALDESLLEDTGGRPPMPPDDASQCSQSSGTQATDLFDKDDEDDLEPTDEDLEEIEEDEDEDDDEPIQLACVSDGESYSVFDVVSGRPLAGVDKALVTFGPKGVRLHLTLDGAAVGMYPSESKEEGPRTL